MLLEWLRFGEDDDDEDHCGSMGQILKGIRCDNRVEQKRQSGMAQLF